VNRDTILPVTDAIPAPARRENGRDDQEPGKGEDQAHPDEIVRALLDKTIENGATADEERAAVAKAEQLIAKHRLERSGFQFPPDRRQLADRTKRRTIREACEELLRQEPALGYEEVLSRVRAEFAGCNTSVKCLRYYATKMRGRDVRVPVRPRASRGSGGTA
jgi:hypothetical protein